MKRSVFTLACLTATVFLMVGADFITQGPPAAVITKKHCVGYVIIEAGKGVDCNGDTLNLVSRGGYYGREAVRNQ